MYEKHFGLTSRPFRSKLEAAGIFVGPSQVKVMANLKKALAASDAVVTLTGPVGVGKSTVVNRALESVCSKRVVAHVGRMQLAADEVLELLLTEFNVSRQPTGTIQRFAAFKRLLHDWAANGMRAFIIVEDAERIGTDALIELEALTAADSGDGTGASIVLMGQGSLSELVSTPALARLRQRIRLRQTVGPFTQAELQGYLKHCMRSAGGDYDQMFDGGALDMFFRCSDGIPRVVNNLCESVLAAAADANASTVMPQLVQHVAQEQFGIVPSQAIRSQPVSQSIAASAPEPDTDAKATTEAKPTVVADPKSAAAAETGVAAPADTRSVAKPAANPPAAEPAPDAVSKSPKPEFEPVPVAEFTSTPDIGVKGNGNRAERKRPDVDGPDGNAAEANPAESVQIDLEPAAPPTDDDIDLIPELIQDTQPELAALRENEESLDERDDDLPDLTDLVVPAAKVQTAKPVAKANGRGRVPTPDDIPTLSNDFEVDRTGDAAPPRPTAKSAPPMPGPAGSESLPVNENEEAAEDPKLDATITEIPAWDRDPTLAELRPDIAALEEALAVVPESPAPAPAKPPAPGAANGQKRKTAAKPFDVPEITLEKELKIKEIEALESKRKAGPPDTREEEADAPAKRKHGFDLDRLAAELGKARSLEDVDDKLAETLFGEEMANAAAEVAAMVAADEAARAGTGKIAPQAAPGQTPQETNTAVTPRNSKGVPGTGIKEASREPPNAAESGAPGAPTRPSPAAAAHAASGPAMEITMQTVPDAPLPPPDSTPETIEEQFGTSMTATLKALSAAHIQQMDESANDEDDKEPRKLFGLFRSSS